MNKGNFAQKAKNMGLKTAHDVKYLWNIFVKELIQVSINTKGQIVNVLRVFRRLSRENIRIVGILRSQFVKRAIERGLLGQEIEHIKNKRWLFKKIDIKREN